MLVLAVGVEKLRVHLERLLELEGADADQVLWLDLALLAAEDLRRRVDLLDALLDRRQLDRLH